MLRNSKKSAKYTCKSYIFYLLTIFVVLIFIEMVSMWQDTFKRGAIKDIKKFQQLFSEDIVKFGSFILEMNEIQSSKGITEFLFWLKKVVYTCTYRDEASLMKITKLKP